MEHFRSYFLQAYTCFNQYKKHWIKISKQKFNNENKIYSIIDNQMYTFTGLDRKEFNNLVELIDYQLQALPAHKITLFDLIGLGLFHMRFYIPECLTELIFGIPSSTYINYFNSFLDVIISVNPYFQLPRNLGDHVKIIDGKKIAIVIDCVEQYIVKSSDGNLEIAAYSGKYNSNTISLLIACSIINGKPFLKSPSYWGSSNDQHIANMISWISLLPEDHYILADKGFIGNLFVTKSHKSKDFMPTNSTKVLDKIIDKERIIVENDIGFCKNKFSICSQPLRFKTTTAISKTSKAPNKSRKAKTKPLKDDDRLLEYHAKIWHVALTVLFLFGNVRKKGVNVSSLNIFNI